ncbi:hypothetical protein [Rahnella aceris]|nr:hypothetical protein [Rahnella aceris]MBU9866801.1 hypothetical protein [Rahnella aceris]
MELTQEEKELIAGYLGQHWQQFVATAEEFMSDRALHALAEKLGLESN